MRKTLAGLVMALTLFMTGCVTVESGEPSTGPSASSTYSSPDERYLDNMESELPSLMGDVNEDALIAAGHSVCDYFDEFGVSPSSFVAFVEGFQSDGTFSDKETATIMTVAMDAYCRPLLDELLAMGGTNV